MSGMPLLRSASERAVRSTESKADLKSRNATFSGRLNSRCSSDRSHTAETASIVDLPAVKPDCRGRQEKRSKRGCMRASKTWANTLPGTDSRVIGL